MVTIIFNIFLLILSSFILTLLSLFIIETYLYNNNFIKPLSKTQFKLILYFSSIFYFIILLFITSPQTKIAISEYNDPIITNKTADIVILIKNNKNKTIIKKIPIDKIDFKRSNQYKLKIVTCKSEKSILSFINKKYETCEQKGYNEGENYILYIKEDIKNFLNN